MSEIEISQPDGTSPKLDWVVAHTRPRCEKKLEQYCVRAGFPVTLPVLQICTQV